MPLPIAYEMRNAVAHGYSKLDLEIVWNTIWKELPALYRHVQSAADELPGEGEGPDIAP